MWLLRLGMTQPLYNDPNKKTTPTPTGRVDSVKKQRRSNKVGIRKGHPYNKRVPFLRADLQNHLLLLTPTTVRASAHHVNLITTSHLPLDDYWLWLLTLCDGEHDPIEVTDVNASAARGCPFCILVFQNLVEYYRWLHNYHE